jgi:hypothetical protein
VHCFQRLKDGHQYVPELCIFFISCRYVIANLLKNASSLDTSSPRLDLCDLTVNFLLFPLGAFLLLTLAVSAIRSFDQVHLLFCSLYSSHGEVLPFNHQQDSNLLEHLAGLELLAGLALVVF